MKNLPRASFYKKSGIYQLCSTVNNKVYIGSSLDLYRRINSHLKSLQQNKHENSHLQNHWNKYGECSLVVNIIELNISRGMLLQREQHYIDKYKDKWRQCFNTSTIAGTVDEYIRKSNIEKLKQAWKADYENRRAAVIRNLEIARRAPRNKERNFWKGRSHSTDSKAKMSKSAKHRGRQEATLMPIIMYSPTTGEPLLKFSCCADAARFFKARVRSGSNISAVCRNKRRKAFGFKWGYDPSKKPRELLETPEEDNQQPSSVNSIIVAEKVQRLGSEELTNNLPTSARQQSYTADDIVRTACITK